MVLSHYPGMPLNSCTGRNPWWLIHALLLTCVFPAWLNAAESTSRPNILFIFLDDFGWKDTGYMGSDFYETPHVDRLASEGMVFTNAYSAAANCAPARASLLSGQYSPRHRVFNVGTGPRGRAAHRRLEHVPGVDVLDPAIKSWARQIQDSGYRTAIMGKWHLSDDPRPYGFDVNVGGTHSGGPPRGYYPPFPKAPGLESVSGGQYLTDVLSDRAVRFIEENRDQPWLLYLTHFAVHTPLDGKKELMDKYRSKTPGNLHDHVAMATMIQAVDDGVGRIRSALTSTGIEDNTIILFYSDNGGYGPATDMAPLKGYKGTYYEGGIRVPFFVKWPGVVSPGTVSHEPVTGVDLYPTLIEMTGAAMPRNQVHDGHSLVPLLKGTGGFPAERPIFWHFPAYLQSYQVMDEQRDPLFRSRPCSVVRLGQWKLHHYFEDNGLELYDLDSDIGETRNLVSVHPGRAAKLYSILDQWRRETGAPVPSSPNPDFDPQSEREAIQRALQRMNR